MKYWILLLCFFSPLAAEHYPLMPITSGPIAEQQPQEPTDFQALFAAKKRSLLFGFAWLAFLLFLFPLYFYRDSLSFKRKLTPKEAALKSLAENESLEKVWRNYLSARFGIDTTYQTTPELIPDLAPLENKDLFIAFLEAADREKFAKEAMPTELAQAMESFLNK